MKIRRDAGAGPRRSQVGALVRDGRPHCNADGSRWSRPCSWESIINLAPDHQCYFETMIFTDGEAEEFQVRCSTRYEAEQHSRVVEERTRRQIAPSSGTQPSRPGSDSIPDGSRTAVNAHKYMEVLLHLISFPPRLAQHHPCTGARVQAQTPPQDFRHRPPRQGARPFQVLAWHRGQPALLAGSRVSTGSLHPAAS
jgi:hypothetical protein